MKLARGFNGRPGSSTGAYELSLESGSVAAPTPTPAPRIAAYTAGRMGRRARRSEGRFDGGGVGDAKKLTEHVVYKHHSVSEMVGDVVHVRHYQGKWQIFAT